MVLLGVSLWRSLNWVSGVGLRRIRAFMGNVLASKGIPTHIPQPLTFFVCCPVFLLAILFTNSVRADWLCCDDCSGGWAAGISK